MAARRPKHCETLTIYGQTYTVGYGYDAAGRENSLTYPDGSVVIRSHTPRSQLQQVDYAPPGGAASLVSSFIYDPGHRENSRTYGNGITTTRSYRADNLVTEIAATNVESLGYLYDVNKNPTAEVRSGIMAPYSWITGATGFDDQNRLTNWSRTNGNSQSWALTPVNDWQQFTNNGVLQNRTHGPAHEITSIDSTPLVHDNRGNLTQDDRGTLMTYDADNMMSPFNANNVTGLKDATYHYDALARRVAKTVAETSGNVTTVYVLANQQVVAEYLASTSTTNSERKYAYGVYIDEPLILVDATGMTETLAYFHPNRQFSTYSLTDNSGSVIEFYAYTPYGAHRCFDTMGSDQGTTPQLGHNTLFTGRSYDSESALHYFRARYFAPKLGRFLGRDPSMYPDGWNTYAGWFAPHAVDSDGTALWYPALGACCATGIAMFGLAAKAAWGPCQAAFPKNQKQIMKCVEDAVTQAIKNSKAVKCGGVVTIGCCATLGTAAVIKICNSMGVYSKAICLVLSGVLANEAL